MRYGAFALIGEVGDGPHRSRCTTLRELRILRIVTLVIYCRLQQVGVIPVATLELDAPLVVGAEMNGKTERDQGSHE